MEDAALAPAPIWCGDLRDFDARPFAGVDMVTAGFPCQPFSAAGKRQGTDDERWLWDDIARILEQAQPTVVILENVPGVIRMGGDRVLGDLAALGFDAEWGVFRADEVGASHKRARWFCVAHAHEPRPQERGGERGDDEQEQSAAERSGVDAVGDADRARADTQPETGCQREAASESGGPVADPAHGDRRRRERGAQEATRAEEQRRWGLASGSAFPPGPTSEFWRTVPEHLHPAIEPGVRVLVDGVAVVVDAARADQLRCAGNGVVPQQAAAAIHELWARLHS